MLEQWSLISVCGGSWLLALCYPKCWRMLLYLVLVEVTVSLGRQGLAFRLPDLGRSSLHPSTELMDGFLEKLLPSLALFEREELFVFEGSWFWLCIKFCLPARKKGRKRAKSTSATYPCMLFMENIFKMTGQLLEKAQSICLHVHLLWREYSWWYEWEAFSTELLFLLKPHSKP